MNNVDAVDSVILIHFHFSTPPPPFLINNFYLEALYHFPAVLSFYLKFPDFQEIDGKVASLMYTHGEHTHTHTHYFVKVM